MCYRMLSSSSVLVGDAENFLYSGDLVKHGCVIDIEKDLPGVKEQCLSLFSKQNLNTFFFYVLKHVFLFTDSYLGVNTCTGIVCAHTLG